MALQDYQHLGQYVTENLMREIGRRGQLSSVQKTDAICVWSMSLGLRKPSEPTLQTLVALKLHLGGGFEDAQASGQDMFDLLKVFKSHWKKMVSVNTNHALEYVPFLPASPAEFAESYPSTWSDFSGVRGNELVDLDERWHLQLASLKAQIPMRRTHSLVERGDPKGRSAGSHKAHEVFEQFMDLLEGNASSLQRKNSLRRRLSEKSPDPRSKVQQASALLDRLQTQTQVPSHAAPARQTQSVAEPAPAHSAPPVQIPLVDAHSAHMPVQKEMALVLQPPSDVDEDVDRPETEPETKATFLAEAEHAADTALAALDAVAGVQKKPAMDAQPVRKTMPTPQKLDPEQTSEPQPNTKKPSQKNRKQPNQTKPKSAPTKKPAKKQPTKKTALQKKPSTAAALPKAPASLMLQFRKGCAKCRYQAKGCSPSCWRQRGYSI